MKGDVNINISVFLLVFIIKFLDCALGSLKTVFLVKNKFFISSTCNSLAAVLFIFVADIMANAPIESKFWIAMAVFLANLTGGYIPPKIVKMLEQDKLFLYVITPTDIISGQKLADILKESGIAVTTDIAYDKYVNKVLKVTAYSTSKQESEIINMYLEKNNYKYHIIEAI